MLTEREQETEAKVMSTAKWHPHRRASGSVDPMDGSPLGRLIKAHFSDDDDRKRYFWAGLLYGHLVDNFQVASGHAAREWGKAPVAPTELTIAEADERREKARIALEKAEEAIREVDNRSVSVMRALCYEDLEIAGRDVGRARNALYKLAVHFKIVRK
jgi:hypothetical protein